MTAISTLTPAAVCQPSPDLSVLLDAVRNSVPLLARDLTPQRISEARRIAAVALQPADPVLIAAWLKKLAVLVVNGPDEARARQQAEAMVEVCGDLPAAVWCPEARRAWARSGERGKFWPAPAELYAHLLPFAEKIRWQHHAARKLVEMAEAAKEAPQRRTPEERAAVERAVNAWRGRQPVQPKDAVRRMQPDQPSLHQRIAECRRQLETADETARAWLEPFIANLEAQHAAICTKEPRGFAHSTVSP
ncbi:hypothetical protein FKW31_03010 [Acetobacter sp. DmW_136]|uniref:hypothetical protein n=1 Tax=Acetobacter sp. DmW_136 TaxID=2591091 RepID=UPI00123BEB1A|nr:hypothetical protein [Acetobacter sp. DmW_136]KAA8387631.1 hypothetical protein FKW31_03010 [Acetobacter sp. DmW_136]